MRLLLAFTLLFCMGNALFANSPSASRFPAGNLTSVDFSATSGPCSGICQLSRTWVFDAGSITLAGGSTFSYAGGVRSINLVAGTALTFQFNEPQRAVGINTDSNVAWSLTASATTSPQAEGGATRAVAAGADVPFVTVDSPYQNSFDSIVISSDVDVTFAISTFVYGETGFYCVGFEEQYPCELTVNSENLPTVNSSIVVYQNVSTSESLYTITGTGGRKVLMCVPEDPVNPFRAVVADNGVEFDTAAESVNMPACTQLHSCYLDPRASLHIPISCLPSEALNAYANGLAVSVTIAQDGTIFRTMELVSTNPWAVVLAVNNVAPGLWVDGNGVTTAENYNCGKGAVNPAYSARYQGECVYPLFGNDFDRFPSLTGELVIRAKCSGSAVPPMNQDVTLYITPEANSILYTIPERGNVDTNVCIINFGVYDIWAIENGTSTGIINANCPNDASSSTCNGTPIDVVSAIFADGCAIPPPVCDVAPTLVSAGGDASGQYPVYLAQNGVLFRTMVATPYSGFATCVLNTNRVSVTMPVAAGVAVSALYDCTERAQDILHPTQNVCKRLGDDTTQLSLFNKVSVDLEGLPEGTINYDINLLTTSNGANYIQTNLPSRPAGSFCGRGGAVDHICVPAVGSDPIDLSCGSKYTPVSIQVFAEECGSNTEIGVNCPAVAREARSVTKDALTKRDDGFCITTSASTDCRKTGLCQLPITQDLCIWDLLYLDADYGVNSKGIVVELQGTVDTGIPVRTMYNQGGCPQTYKVLTGFTRVKIIENPQNGTSDPNAPSLKSPLIQCQAAKTCVWNDFLSILDLTGHTAVTGTVGANDASVKCSAISYLDNYSPSGVKQALNNVDVALSVQGSSVPFRPAQNLGETCTGANEDCNNKAQIAVVLKTTDITAYTVHYSWASVDRSVDLACTSKTCDNAPCLVRWAATDPSCPDLRFQAEFLPTGVQPDNNDDPHRDLYKYSSIVSAPTATVNGVTLCSEEIKIGSTRDTACRNAAFDEIFAPQGFTDNESMYRYFLLAKEGSDPYPFTVHAGCASTAYELDCPFNVADSGRKAIIPANVVVPDYDCTPERQEYWHTCKFRNLADNLKGPNQYWRTELSNNKRAAPQPVVTDETCLAANAVSTADPWCPLSPFTVVSVDLTELPNGTVPEADRDNITLTPNDDQKNYQGRAFQNDDISVSDNIRNPFDLSICCDNCGQSAMRSLKQEHSSKSFVSTSWTAPTDQCGPGRINGAAGYDHLVCVLAGADYSYKLEERYRNEKRSNFLPLNPDICPPEKNIYEWNQRIKNCRPNYCVVKNTSVPVRYPVTEWTNLENKLFDNIEWGQTYSTNYQCPGTIYSHTLLRPNRLARPAEDNIPHIKGKWYEWRVNNQFQSSHSDKFTCFDNDINPGFCNEKENNLASSNPALRTEPQE